jgi:hypothetical protein
MTVIEFFAHHSVWSIHSNICYWPSSAPHCRVAAEVQIVVAAMDAAIRFPFFFSIAEPYC